MEEEGSQKRKNKRDVAWWQLEGKRRSQRVRVNVVSTPTKPKPQNTLAEILRNIIPDSLL